MKSWMRIIGQSYARRDKILDRNSSALLPGFIECIITTLHFIVGAAGENVLQRVFCFTPSIQPGAFVAAPLYCTHSSALLMAFLGEADFGYYLTSRRGSYRFR